MALVWWLLAVILVVSGIVTLFRGPALLGLLLVVLGLLIGPGAVSVVT